MSVTDLRFDTRTRRHSKSHFCSITLDVINGSIGQLPKSIRNERLHFQNVTVQVPGIQDEQLRPRTELTFSPINTGIPEDPTSRSSEPLEGDQSTFVSLMFEKEEFATK